jgi:hypothetical protein
MKTDSRRTRFTVVLLCGAVLLGIIAIIRLAPKPWSPGPVAEPETAGVVSQSTQRQAVLLAPDRLPAGGKPPVEWGIEVVGLYPAVGGRVLDLRYKILDTAKAALLPNEVGGIYLMDESSGLTTRSPNSAKTGSIPQNPQKLETGRTYSLAFPNPEGRFKSGSKMTLIIGNFQAEHLAVK